MTKTSVRLPLSSTGAALMQRLDHLATFTETPEEGLTRTYLTPTLKAAGEQLIEWMQSAGMTARFDGLGNVVGRYAGDNNKNSKDTAPALLLGSHYDSVRNAGKYDGPYGIVAALAVVETLHKAKRRLPFPLDLVAFGDEEGVRFKSTLIGSRGLAGTLDPAVFDTKDADGITMKQALAAFGGSAAKLASVARAKGSVRGYIELHIEQGPVLIAEKLPVGVVTSIAGASRFIITITGEAGHAGTVPMDMRKDALAGAATFVLAVEARCAIEPSLVGTVGMLSTPGGATNVVPGAVELSLDVRAETDNVRKAAVADLKAVLKDICKGRGLKADIRKTHDAKAVQCEKKLRAALAASIAARDLRVRELPSGAGHDAMALADLCPVAMLFVRCGNGGISHDPRETMTAKDAEIGAQILLDTVLRLAD